MSDPYRTKARGPLPVKYAVVARQGHTGTEHNSPESAQEEAKSTGGKVVRYYGLDVTHAWDDKGNMVHNRYKDKPMSPYHADYAFRK